MAAVAAATDSETISMNAKPRISPKESRRARRIAQRLWLLLFRDVPNAVQRALQLREDGRSPDEQHHKADCSRHEPAVRVAGAGDETLDQVRAVLADETRQLAGDLPHHRVAPEDRTRNGDDDHQQRRQGKDGVIGDGRAHARREVIDPRAHRFLAKPKGMFEIHVAP